MHPLPPDPLVNSSIPITTAITRVTNWKTAFGAAAQAQGTSPLILPQAAYIPIADIMALADKYQHLYSMKVTGVRAYFGLEHPRFEGHIRLLLVPVVEMVPVGEMVSMVETVPVGEVVGSEGGSESSGDMVVGVDASGALDVLCFHGAEIFIRTDVGCPCPTFARFVRL